MKSFKTVLNEGRLEEGLFHSLVKAHLKTVVYKNKLRGKIFYYDKDVTSGDDIHFDTEILGVVKVFYTTNSKGDIAYDYEAL